MALAVRVGWRWLCTGWPGGGELEGPPWVAGISPGVFGVVIIEGWGSSPAGTVTLLFSDIEGSTALLSRLGERYGEALSDQRALMRAAFSAAAGRSGDGGGQFLRSVRVGC